MKTAIVTLNSVSPYSQSRVISEKKPAKEGHEDFEKRTWKQRMHVAKSGNVFIPPTAFKNCISDAAKFLSIQVPGKGKSTYTKNFEAGLLVTEPLELDVTPDDVDGEWLFVPASGRRGDGKRVWKCFPYIPEWTGEIKFLILDETVMDTTELGGKEQTVFEYVLDEAGKFIGIGRFRPRNNGFYGRFEVASVKWI
jgi:hypothetical protein